MAFTLDPQLAPALLAQEEAAAGITLPDRGDALGWRALLDEAMLDVYGAIPDAPDVTAAPLTTTTGDGAEIPMRWYSRNDPATGAAIVYVHGGGMICGTLDNYDRLVRHYVQLTGVPFLAVGYRLAPEVHGTTLAEDSFLGIKYLLAHADEFGVDRARIAIMGDSGGGGVAAGAAILARSRHVSLAKQILIFPMLDDRNTVPDPFLSPTARWTYDHNYTGWSALLGDDLGTESVSPVAAPARLRDFRGLAAAYIEVGELDIFRDECINYATSLLKAGISCELHVHPGSPHGHDWLNPDADVSRRAILDRARIITSL